MNKILWIDDEHEKLVFFKLMAQPKGLELVCESNLEDGITTLRRLNIEINAIILDIRCPLSSSNQANPANTSNVTSALLRIINMKSQLELEHLPIYIFSGAGPEFIKRVISDWCHENIRAYDKSEEGAGEKMLCDIKTDIDAIPQNKIKARYKAIFSCPFLHDISVSLLSEMIKRTSINTLRSIAEQALARVTMRLELFKADTPLEAITINKATQELLLADQSVVPVYVSQACQFICKVGNTASHHPEYSDVPTLYETVLDNLVLLLNWAADCLRSDQEAQTLASQLRDLKRSRPQVDWNNIKSPEDLKGKTLRIKGTFSGQYFKLIPRRGLEISENMTIEVVDAQWDDSTDKYSFFIRNYRIISNE